MNARSDSEKTIVGEVIATDRFSEQQGPGTPDQEDLISTLKKQNQLLQQELDEVRLSECRFQRLYDNAIIGFYRTTPDGHILDANPALIHMLGFESLEELQKRNLEQEGFEPEYQRSAFKDQLEKFGRIRGLETQWTRMDGTCINVRENALAIRNDQGQIVYYEGSVEDLSECKEAEDALWESEKLLEITFDAIQEGFSILDKNLNIIRTNSIMEQRFKRNMPLVGKKCFTCYHDTRQPCADCPAIKCLETGKATTHVVPGLSGSGKWFELFVYPWKRRDSETIEGVIELVLDVTERKDAENKLLDYQDKLRAMTSKLSLAEERERRFIAEHLHDSVAQTLVFIKMKLEHLTQRMGPSSEQTEQERLCGMLETVISDIKDLTFELSCPVLKQLGLVSAIEKWLDEHIASCDGVTVRLNADPIRQILPEDLKAILYRSTKELSTNAIKHGQARTIEVSICVSQPVLEIHVKDDGHGFNPADLETSTHPTGFGLFSIRERLSQVQGSLTIQSSPGQGCLATITIPVG